MAPKQYFQPVITTSPWYNLVLRVQLQSYFCFYSEISANVWTHVVFTWNRKTRKGKLYFDGKQVGDKTSSYQGQDIDLKLTNHTVYEIGFKKDTGELLQGSLRDLAVFLRTLSPAEVSKLYSEFPLFFFVSLKTIGV